MQMLRYDEGTLHSQLESGGGAQLLKILYKIVAIILRNFFKIEKFYALKFMQN